MGCVGWVEGCRLGSGVLVGFRGRWGEMHKGWGVPQGVVSPLPSSSSLTVLASFSASSLSFFSSSRECFSSALAPAPMLSPAALRFTTRSLEVSTKMGSELQLPAASRAGSRFPAAAASTVHPVCDKDGAKVPGGRLPGGCAQHPGLKRGPPDKPPSICSGLSSAIPRFSVSALLPGGPSPTSPQLCLHPGLGP